MDRGQEFLRRSEDVGTFAGDQRVAVPFARVQAPLHVALAESFFARLREEVGR